MDQIPSFDWLPEQARWRYPARPILSYPRITRYAPEESSVLFNFYNTN